MYHLLLDLWQNNFIRNGHLFSLLNARSVFTFFLLALVVMVDIASRTEEMITFNADRLLLLTLLVERAC